MSRAPDVDRTAGWLAVGVLVTLVGSEAALTLPDQYAASVAVAGFYQAHRPAVVVLQLVGLLTCVLLAAFAWRLRRLGVGVAVSGVLLAAAAALPSVTTLAIALVADPAHPDAAGRLNRLEPRADDALFVGVIAFACALLLTGDRVPRWVTGAAAAAEALCLLRLLLEAAGREPAAVDTLAAVSFLVLVVLLAVLCFRGDRRARNA